GMSSPSPSHRRLKLSLVSLSGVSMPGTPVNTSATTHGRARKIERFLSQPFFVAEVFTGFPGIYTPLKDTIDSFKRLCDGEGDDIPESAFMYVGTLDDAKAKAEKMAAAAG
ncbi:MAG: hypothetical protein AAGJ38_08800, partial [Planctomycetota bacterium]